MNTLVKHLVELIAAVAVLLLIINFMFPGLLSGLISGSGITDKSYIKFSEEPHPVITLVGSDPDLRNYEYSIVFNGAHVEYQGKMEDAMGPIPNLYIVPVIDFKGVSKKAFVDESTDNTFELTTDVRTFEGTFRVELMSSLPPLRIVGNPFEDTLTAGDTVVLKSYENNLTVRLASVKEKTTGIWPFDQSTCIATIDANCGEPVTLKLRAGCGADEDKTDCDRYLKICNGNVHINVTDTNCRSKKAKIRIEFSGGMDYNAEDAVGISFWKISNDNCESDSHTYNELWDRCRDDFLGRHFFKEVIQPE